MDIDAARLADSEAVARKLVAAIGVAGGDRAFHRSTSRARRRRLRRRRVPDRRLRPCTITDFEVPRKIRPPPHYRRHARRRRDHARIAHRPALVAGLRGHERALPSGDPHAIRQPDGDQHLGDFGALPENPPGRALPFGAGHSEGTRARPRDPVRTHPLPRVRASTIWRSIFSSRRSRPTGLGETSIPTSSPAIAPAGRPSRIIRAVRTRCATKC